MKEKTLYCSHILGFIYCDLKEWNESLIERCQNSANQRFIRDYEKNSSHSKMVQHMRFFLDEVTIFQWEGNAF